MATELTEAQQKKRINLQFVGLAIYIICCSGSAGMTTFFVYMSTQYGCTVTQAVLGSSICNIVAFICGQFAGGVVQRYGARTSMVISLLGVLVGFLIMAFAPNIYVAWVGFACCGLMYSFGLTMPVGAMVRTWWIKDQGTILGSILGLSGIGGALWPMLAGIMLQAFGLTKMLLLYTPLFVVPGLLAVLLLKEKPEDCGMKPVGWSEEAVAAQAAAAKAAAAQGASSKSVYLMPLFWVCGIVLIIQVITQSASSLMPTALQTAGVAVGVASSICSISSIVAIPAQVFTGWLRDKVGYLGFIAFNYGAFILSSLCFVVWMQVDPGNAASIFLWLVMILQGFARAMLYMPAHMAGLLFPECANVAQARMQSLVALGGVVILPLVSSFAESAGSYLPVAYLWIAAAAFAGIAWFVLVARQNKKNAAAA